MADFSLNQNLSQQQTLAPQMRKSLEILQANAQELSQLVRQELETNPVLEDVSESQSLDADGPDPETADSLEYLNETDDDWRDDAILSGRQSTWSEADEERRQRQLESLVTPETLQQHLRLQLERSPVDAETRFAASVVLGSLDDRGFLDQSPREIALRHGLSRENLDAGLALVRSFDPPGVGAADLTESLRLQLERLGRGDSLASRIVADHLPALARHQYEAIARALGSNPESVADAAQEISRLSPDPGASFSPGGNPFVSPDVVIERGDSGNWEAWLTHESLPSLRINDHYRDLSVAARTDAATRRFLRERLNDGRSLIRAIELRQETILAIAYRIIEHQRDFLERGPRYMRPLTMTVVAGELGMHNATVSRAVAGKYVRTPFGLLEMRAFFPAGLPAGDGGIAVTAVHDAIRKLIQRESPAKPLNDGAIAKQLDAQGIAVARRTVAKYREQLGIPPASQRKGK